MVSAAAEDPAEAARGSGEEMIDTGHRLTMTISTRVRSSVAAVVGVGRGVFQLEALALAEDDDEEDDEADEEDHG